MLNYIQQDGRHVPDVSLTLGDNRDIIVRRPLQPLFELREDATAITRNDALGFWGPWRSFEAVEFATLEWVDWFNNRRLLEPIGNIPPAEAEERYYAMLEQPAMAA